MDMILPTMSAIGASATPIQNSVMLPTIRPMPPTTKPRRATVTAVQAAGVLPWLSDMVLLEAGVGAGMISGRGRQRRV